MQLLQHFHKLSLHPKNAKELKGLILQLAVQGKLTRKWREENPDIEPASVLLEQIKANKTALIKENKFRQERVKKEFKKDQTNYDIPGTWISTNITELYYTIGSKRNQIKTNEYLEEGQFPVVSQGQKLIEGFCNDKKKTIAVDKPVIVFGDHTRVIKLIDFDFVIGADGTKVLLPLDGFLSRYFYIFLNSIDLSNRGYARHYSHLKNEAVALPPLPEQKTIVSIVEQLFAEVEQLEQLTEKRIRLKEDFAVSALARLSSSSETDEKWKSLQPHFHTFFNEESNIKKLRETILQLAVQGKLTQKWRTENPGVEDAATILERIKAEKARLVKEKKIRKEKALPPISEEEVPYELPEGWVWTTFQGVIKDLRYGTSKKCYPEIGPNPVLRIPNISDGSIDLEHLKYTSLSEKEMRDLNLEKGDLLLIRSNGSAGLVGRSAVIDHRTVGYSFAGYLVRVRLFNELISSRFLYYMLETPFIRDSIELPIRTTSGVKNINSTEISQLMISLPPLEEQKAIVAKVNRLMALCDELEEQVSQSKRQAEDLMQAVVREVFEGKKEYVQEERVAMAAEGMEEYKPLEPVSLLDKQVLMMAKVIDLHHSSPYDNLGHVKMEKILHFVEKLLNHELGRQHWRLAAGPADSKRLTRAIARGKELGYFQDIKHYHPDSDRHYFRFLKKSGFGLALEKYHAQFIADNESIENLIQQFLPKSYEESKIAATVFDAWEGLLIKYGKEPSEEEIINEAKYNYHDEKRSIPKAEFRKELRWLRKEGLNPMQS